MSRNDWIEHAVRLQNLDQPYALVTVLSAEAPTSGKSGDKAVVTKEGQIFGWIGGGCAQPAVIKTVRSSLSDGIPRRISINSSEERTQRDLGEVLEFGMTCHSGGKLELFIDPVLPLPTLTVIGDSPVARALVCIAPRIGFHVVAVAHGAENRDYPDADLFLSDDEIGKVKNEISKSDFVVTATQGRRDLQGLKVALSLNPEGSWFVASEKKAKVLFGNLITGGEDPKSVGKIVAPAGESIGAQTPEEIALSVLSSVVAVRRGRQPSTCCADKKSMPAPMPAQVATHSCCEG